MRSALSAILLMLLLPLCAAAQAAQEESASPFGEIPSQPMQAIEIRALNKTTARTSLMKVNLGDIIQFDTLDVQVRTCWTAPPDQKPEHAALLRVIENDPDTGPKTLFYGWMFASSPALNALEHPIYDLTVIRCLPSRVTTELVDDTLE